jgi:tripartite-type tricarboxylate transporter receptor subunit TctC
MPRTTMIAAAALALAVLPAAAGEWPTRPVTMVVPFAPGGGSDVVARILVPRLSELLGQQVVRSRRAAYRWIDAIRKPG